jgi:hypothetical protein
MLNDGTVCSCEKWRVVCLVGEFVEMQPTDVSGTMMCGVMGQNEPHVHAAE